MAIDRVSVVALVPGLRSLGAEVLRVPGEADAELRADFDAVVFDRGLLAADLVLLRRDTALLAARLDAALRRAADAEMDAETVARARAVLRRHAQLEVALGRLAHPQSPPWRDWLGLALLPLVVLGERLRAAGRWLGAVRWDRGNVSPLVRVGVCVGFFLVMWLLGTR